MESEDRDHKLRQVLDLELYYHKNVDSWRVEPPKHQHVRRTNAELEKTIECPFAPCSKKYDRPTALNLHIKQKHNGGNKFAREEYARCLVELYSKGGSIPEEKIVDQLATLPNIPF